MRLFAFSESNCPLEILSELITDILLQLELTLLSFHTFIIICSFLVEEMVFLVPPFSINYLPTLKRSIETTQIDAGHFSYIFTVIDPYSVIHVSFSLKNPEPDHYS